MQFDESKEDYKDDGNYANASMSPTENESKMSEFEDPELLKGSYEKRIAEEKEEYKDDDFSPSSIIPSENQYQEQIESSSTVEQDIGRTYNYFYPKLFQRFMKRTNNAIDPTVPQYLLEHYKGNYNKAKKRHDLIEEWKRELNIEERLNYKPKFFDLTEEYLQTIMVGRGKNGEIVFCESYKKIDLDRFKELGVTPIDFNNFLIFIHQYVKVYLNNDAEGKKANPCFVIIDAPTMDLKGALKKEVYRYTEINMELMENFYPTHIKKVFVANPPNVLKHIWRSFKLVMPKSLADKFYMVDSPTVLEDHIDPNIVPIHLGGLKKEENVKNNEVYLQFRSFVDSLPSQEEYMATKN